MIEALEKMLADGRDSALLRFGLGNAYLGRGEAVKAVAHLAQAVVLDPEYSAAWKLLGKAHEAAGDFVQALDAWRHGVDVAQRRGDQQVANEMRVYAKRAERAIGR
ncbi:MAG: hypothetical protein MUF30_05130 [Burkholderiales bacterium]|jgi:predicted Zn-dependent protease|nr:hypothetical protein [Burkholderiales bacterium]